MVPVKDRLEEKENMKMCKKVTSEKFYKIKGRLLENDGNLSDVMQEFGIGHTTASLIRRVPNYKTYRAFLKEKREREKARRRLTEITLEAQYDRLRDNHASPVSASGLEPKMKTDNDVSSASMVIACLALLTFIAVVITVIVKFVGWILFSW